MTITVTARCDGRQHGTANAARRYGCTCAGALAALKEARERWNANSTGGTRPKPEPAKKPVREVATRPKPWRYDSWKNRGNCVGTDPEAFYPEVGYLPDDAKRICRNCDVRADCLEYALANGEMGVWGGTTEKERRAIIRKGRQKAAVAAARGLTAAA